MVFIFVFIVSSNLYHMFLIDARKIKFSTYPSAKLCVLLVSHVLDSIQIYCICPKDKGTWNIFFWYVLIESLYTTCVQHMSYGQEILKDRETEVSRLAWDAKTIHVPPNLPNFSNLWQDMLKCVSWAMIFLAFCITYPSDSKWFQVIPSPPRRLEAIQALEPGSGCSKLRDLDSFRLDMVVTPWLRCG